MEQDAVGDGRVGVGCGVGVGEDLDAHKLHGAVELEHVFAPRFGIGDEHGAVGVGGVDDKGDDAEGVGAVAGEEEAGGGLGRAEGEVVGLAAAAVGLAATAGACGVAGELAHGGLAPGDVGGWQRRGSQSFRLDVSGGYH